MIEVRRRLADWPAPVELAGDYLDGVASEGALCSGEQAADRLVSKLRLGPAGVPRQPLGP
jgi:predicted NAD/FAD-dependent oxidoreductase